MTQKVSIRYLIDVAIGNPEPGIVNFNALYTVLLAISEKLFLQDHDIEIDSTFCPVSYNVQESKSNTSSEKLMDRQVFEIPSDLIDQDISRQRTGEIPKDKTEEVHKKISRKSIPDEDRRVAFEPIRSKTGAEESVSIRSPIRPKESDRLVNYRSEIKQHTDALNSRLARIEDSLAINSDRDHSFECLKMAVNHLKQEFEAVQTIFKEAHETRDIKEQCIEACQTKAELERLAVSMEDLKREVTDLKDIFDKNSPKWSLKPPSIGLFEESVFDTREDISRLRGELMEIRTECCILKEKLVNFDGNPNTDRRSLSTNTISKLQQEVVTLKENINIAAAHANSVKNDHEGLRSTIQDLAAKLDELTQTKIDKEEIDELLSEKADYTMLQRKVSVENMEAGRRKLDKQIDEIIECFVMNEERVQKQIHDLKTLVGDQSMDNVLRGFKTNVDSEIQIVRNAIKKLLEMKPDVDTAASRLKDLSCLACDQDVVMKAIEMNNLSKFGDAYVSKSINPLIVYEVGKLRQAGKIGPMEVDNALHDMARNFRHSGGLHTIVTNKDRVSKVKSHRRPKSK